MQLFYSQQIGEKEILLEEEESRHMFSVLRKKEGDTVQVLDGRGSLYTCAIESRGKREAKLRIQSKEQQPKRLLDLHIAIAPTKNIERTEWFLEKCIELGIEKVSFIQCDRSERKQVNMERMMKIALSACKQSYSFHFPRLTEIRPFEGFLNEASGQKLLASCEPQVPLLDKSWQGDNEICILVGPEGDFSPREYEMAKTNGWQPFSLGQKRLRTETAGIAICDRINFIFGL